MKINLQQLYLAEKIFLAGLLIASLIGYWYFEYSWILRTLSIIISLVGISLAYFQKNQPKLGSHKELIILLILYLSTYSLYNLLYSLNLPIYLIMIAILGVVSLAFFILLSLDGLDKLIEKPVFNLLVILMGLVVLEIFLSLYFWPIDPKIKSLIIVLVFYLSTNLIYLFAHGILKIRKIMGYLIVTIVIFGALFLTTWLNLR